MQDTIDSLLQSELAAFSKNDWSKNSEFIFSSISLKLKRDANEKWFISCKSHVEIIVDSALLPQDIFIPISKFDHFLQVKKGNFTYLFVFLPAKNKILRLDALSGACVKADRFTRIFPGKTKVSGIENLDFVIHPSEFVGIYGESGIGKSVLINSILGTISEGKVSGKLAISDSYDQIISKNEISYLPQIIDIPQYLSCLEILQAAMIDRSIDGIYGMNEIVEVLRRCSLEESILYKKYRQISEGQKRRLGIAATLLKKHSQILIADEPTTGLDVYSEEQVMGTLRSISRSGITVLVVTHSVISAPIMDRVLVLKKVADNCGAVISYDGPVDIHHLDIISSAVGGENTNQEDVQCGYFFPVTQSIHKDCNRISTVKKNLLSCYLTFLQAKQWVQNVFKTIFRDWTSILVFGILAVVCALAIQFGTNSYNGNNPENILLTLFSLAAPWLCAMFAAISVSELNRYFVWEHFSGLKSMAFLSGTVLAHAVPAFCIAFIFSIGLFFAPRNCEIAKRLICRGITEKTSDDEISKRLWFVKGTDNIPEEDRDEQEIKKVQDAREDYISDCKDYASRPVLISQWYTPIKHGDSSGLDKAVAYCPIMQLYNDSLAIPSDEQYSQDEVSPRRGGNYPLAKGKAYGMPQNIFLIFCIELLIMWGISWIGSMIGITSAVILGNAKNAAVSIIVIFVFFILFSRIFISSDAAMTYLQPLAEMPTNISTIDFQDMGAIIPIYCSYVCLGRYASNLLAYAFSGASLQYDVLALCAMASVCLFLSLVILTKKRMTK